MSSHRPPSRFPRLLAAALIVLSAGAQAQPAGTVPRPLDAPRGPAAQLPPRPGLPPVPAAPAAPVDAATTVDLDGAVARWLTNPNGEVDGMLLTDGTQVGFPPHFSAQVTDAVKLNDAVALSGWRDGPVFRAVSVRNTATRRSVHDVSPPMQPPAWRDPAALTELSASGRVAFLLRGPRGEINGVVLQGGEQVRFPPHVGIEYAALLRVGAPLSARGYGTRNAFGTAFEATAIGDSGASLRQVFFAPRPPAAGHPVPPPAPVVRPAS